MQKIRRKGARPVMELLKTENPDGSELMYLQAPALRALPWTEHAFSTRIGGVSEGVFSSMSLRFGHGDEDARVRENFHRMAQLLGTDEAHMVLSRQTHTTNVRVVTEKDAGCGITKEYSYDDIDGLVTDVPGLALGIFAADCVPLLYADPVHHAVGAAHSGWRGTVQRMGAETIRVMQENFGTDPKDLLCVVGPSICRDCYEVSEDVAQRFMDAFPLHVSEILQDDGMKKEASGYAHKYHLDLWAANRIVLEEAGVPRAQITVTDICTNDNPSLLFSHRFTKGQRGNNGVFIMRKEN